MARYRKFYTNISTNEALNTFLSDVVNINIIYHDYTKREFK